MSESRSKAIVEENSVEELSFTAGIKEGIPIALGYIPIAITFGLVAESAGINKQISILMSLLVFAGASQFVAVNLLAVGSGVGEVILTTFIVNLRHLLMAASISQRFRDNVSKGWRALLAFGITDETFSLASLRSEEKLSTSFMLGLNLISYLSWVAGTGIGVFVGAELPSAIQASMGIALYAMFIGLLVPSLQKSYSVVGVVIFAVVINSLLNWLSVFSSISDGWKIVITTILAAFLGAVLFPKEESN
ncbi:AzlC family ABC transporter permease [Acetohalobium arabaticum]|uniref:AzlC family protein n=1 Tax=Acetohalobium arabaticum (strain ATCC 49924 / DSM 5501 / Z-7288) TaxID=574087 RepID=D9QQ60_ACEAZ|nr:AzlC family ABC transporter permease [Acetohalobium arabaticum]ADL12651.1 AzlC family protein [Acetohalobium arabaticum DSM 5501]